MTSDVAYLAMWVFLLALVVSYVCWSKLRVIIIRQKMFDVRDALWLEAHRLGGFDDPAYQYARKVLNACIRNAHAMSLPLLARVWEMRGTTPVPPVSDNAELQAAIESAKNEVCSLTFHYVFFYRPFSGLVWAIFRRVAFTVRDSMTNWFRTGGPIRLDGTLHGC